MRTLKKIVGFIATAAVLAVVAGAGILGLRHLRGQPARRPADSRYPHDIRRTDRLPIPPTRLKYWDSSKSDATPTPPVTYGPNGPPVGETTIRTASTPEPRSWLRRVGPP